MARNAEKLRREPPMSRAEAARIRRGALSDPDNLPSTDEQLARMRPLYQVLPALAARSLRAKRGRPRVAAPKKQVTLRLDQAVIDHFRAGGRGW